MSEPPANYCGDGKVDAGEVCDGNCPTDCDDGDPCTADTMSGQVNHCDVKCSHAAVTVDKTGDGCCLKGHLSTQDSDCKSECAKDADCASYWSVGCKADDNTCGGFYTTATCVSGKCQTQTVDDNNACKREIVCGAGYSRNFPCPLGCYCSNHLDCAAAYKCVDGPVPGRGTCQLGARQ